MSINQRLQRLEQKAGRMGAGDPVPAWPGKLNALSDDQLLAVCESVGYDPDAALGLPVHSRHYTQGQLVRLSYLHGKMGRGKLPAAEYDAAARAMVGAGAATEAGG
jgi:hypothetical protein